VSRFLPRPCAVCGGSTAAINSFLQRLQTRDVRYIDLNITIGVTLSASLLNSDLRAQADNAGGGGGGARSHAVKAIMGPCTAAARDSQSWGRGGGRTSTVPGGERGDTST
jgi:hypothetical protein